MNKKVLKVGMPVLFTSVFLFFHSAMCSDLKSVKLGLGDPIEFTRAHYSSEAFKGEGLNQALFDMRAHKINREFRKCSELAESSLSNAQLSTKGLQPWVFVEYIDCEKEGFSSSASAVAKAHKVLGLALKNPSWFLSGAQVPRLREAYADLSLLLLAEQNRSQRAQSFETINRISQLVLSDMNTTQRARFFYLQGELNFLEQNLAAAVSALEKSLKEQEVSSVRERLKIVQAEYYRAHDIKPPEPLLAVEPDPVAELSREEQAHFDRFENLVRTNDVIGAITAGVQFIRTYPGSVRSQRVSRQIINIYTGLMRRTGDEFIPIRRQAISEMKKADAQRLFDWARTLTARRAYEEAVELGSGSVELLGGQPVVTEVLLHIGRSAVHSSEVKVASEMFARLIREHSGTLAAAEAMFRQGLLLFRQEKYSEAIALFERYLLLPAATDFELATLYWMWRANQKLESKERADQVAAMIVERFPLSYYGLRARKELNDGVLKFSEELSKDQIQTEIWLSPSDLATYERFLKLLKVGWHAEAQSELSHLPEPPTPMGKVIFARLWGLSLDYLSAFSLLTSAWREDPRLLTKDVLRLAYPTEFTEMIEAETKRYGVDTLLVYSLIRQESTFRVGAVSPAGALGIMQIMPVTGREIANDIRIRNFSNQSLFDPQINIRIGTNYLYRRLRNFNGHVPLALASYNAGIGNVRGWASSRKDLPDLSSVTTSEPSSEVWFDELPWSETTGYIKTILRNWMIYRYLDEGPVKFNDPLWRI